MFLAYTWLVEMCHMVSYLLPFSHCVAKWITISCNIICNKSIRGKRNKTCNLLCFDEIIYHRYIAVFLYTVDGFCFFSRCCFVMFKIFCKQLCCQENIVIISESAKKPRGRWVVDTFLRNLLSFDTVRSRSIFPFRYY